MEIAYITGSIIHGLKQSTALALIIHTVSSVVIRSYAHFRNQFEAFAPKVGICLRTMNLMNFITLWERITGPCKRPVLVCGITLRIPMAFLRYRQGMVLIINLVMKE